MACFPEFRMRGFTALAITLLALIYYLSPAQLPIVAHKLSLICLAGVLGYWLDRHLFPYARPHIFGIGTWPSSAAQYRRAIIVGSTMIAFGLAL